MDITALIQKHLRDLYDTGLGFKIEYLEAWTAERGHKVSRQTISRVLRGKVRKLRRASAIQLAQFIEWKTGVRLIDPSQTLAAVGGSEDRVFVQAMPYPMLRLDRQGSLVDYRPGLYADRGELATGLGANLGDILRDRGGALLTQIDRSLAEDKPQDCAIPLSVGSQRVDLELCIVPAADGVVVAVKHGHDPLAGRLLSMHLTLHRLKNELGLCVSRRAWDEVLVKMAGGLGKYVEFLDSSVCILHGERLNYAYRACGALDCRPYPQRMPRFSQHLSHGNQQPVYRKTRRDLELCDDRVLFRESIIDIPFCGGTIAVNSNEEDAFDADAVAVLVEFTNVLHDVYAREHKP